MVVGAPIELPIYSSSSASAGASQPERSLPCPPQHRAAPSPCMHQFHLPVASALHMRRVAPRRSARLCAIGDPALPGGLLTCLPAGHQPGGCVNRAWAIGGIFMAMPLCTADQRVRVSVWLVAGVIDHRCVMLLWWLKPKYLFLAAAPVRILRSAAGR